MASMDVYEVNEVCAKHPKLDMDVASDVTHYFPQRDKEVHTFLKWMMQDENGQPYIRLPMEVENKIVNMVHNEEHRDRMAKVVEQMDQLPKCKTCGTVSTLVSFS